MEKAALFWSGGKDSAFALYKLQQTKQFRVEFLVTTLTRDFGRVSMHGIREELLDEQARSIDILLYKMWLPADASNGVYERVLQDTFHALKEQGVTTVIFGDIFLEDLRIYREKQAKGAGLKCFFPLWGSDTRNMISEFLESDFKAVTCAISTKYLSMEFLGKEVSTVFVDNFPAGADVCGENGEYHTFCFDGPIFSQAVGFLRGEEKCVPMEVRATGSITGEAFCFVDLIPASSSSL